MKKFKNQKTEILFSPEGEKTLMFSDLAIICANRQRREGFTPDILRKRIRLIELFEKNKESESINVEDADYAELKKLVEDFPWAMIHKDLLKFTDYVINK